MSMNNLQAPHSFEPDRAKDSVSFAPPASSSPTAYHVRLADPDQPSYVLTPAVYTSAACYTVRESREQQMVSFGWLLPITDSDTNESHV